MKPEIGGEGRTTGLEMTQRTKPLPPIQTDDINEYTIVGSDVEALFPSLRDLESARIVREAIETSSLTFENVDVTTALRYLKVVGGAGTCERDRFCQVITIMVRPET